MGTEELRKAVLKYVKNGDWEEKDAIVGLNQWTTLTSTRTVYRGQGKDDGEKDPSKMSLFSVSTSRKIALEEFSGDEGCIWTIQLLPGIQYIDVNKLLGEHKQDFESELLVKGGGKITFQVSRDPLCKISATYGPPDKEVTFKEVTIEELRNRAEESGMGDMFEDKELESLFLNPGEKLKEGGGKRKRRKTRRTKKVKGRTRKNRK